MLRFLNERIDGQHLLADRLAQHRIGSVKAFHLDHPARDLISGAGCLSNHRASAQNQARPAFEAAPALANTDLREERRIVEGGKDALADQ